MFLERDIPQPSCNYNLVQTDIALKCKLSEQGKFSFIAPVQFFFLKKNHKDSFSTAATLKYCDNSDAGTSKFCCLLLSLSVSLSLHFSFLFHSLHRCFCSLSIPSLDLFFSKLSLLCFLSLSLSATVPKSFSLLQYFLL